MIWVPGNLLEDPLVTGLFKWSLVVKNKLIKVNILVVEEQFQLGNISVQAMWENKYIKVKASAPILQ